MTRPKFPPTRHTGGGVGAQTPCPPGDPDSPAGTATTQASAPRQWRIEFPARQELLNANDRRHWSARARITRQVRGDGLLLARHHKIPRMKRVHVETELPETLEDTP